MKTAANPKGDCVMIDKHIEEKRIAPKAASWFNSSTQNPKPDPVPRRGALWGDVAEEEDDDDSLNVYFAGVHDDGDQKMNEDANMDMDCPQDNPSLDTSHTFVDHDVNAPTIQRKGNSEAVERRMRAAGFRPAHSGTQAPLGSGTATMSTAAASLDAANRDPNAEIMQVLRTMQESITSKDAMIQQLQETIKGLNVQIAAMAAAITSMQQAAGGVQPSLPQQRSQSPLGGAALPTSAEANAAS